MTSLHAGEAEATYWRCDRGQKQRGYSALLTGFVLLPQMAMAAVGSPVSGRIAAQGGVRTPMGIGLRLGAGGLLGLVPSVERPYWVLILPSIASGLGFERAPRLLRLGSISAKE